MADYWIKLYHDILDDPKMATMPDNLWRRVIELFLLAGKLYKDGELPDTKQIAWCLRQNAEILALELTNIASTTGIILPTETGWFIPKFKTRQDPMSNSERVRKFRETKQHEQYNADETVLKRKVTQITDNRSDQITDNRSDAESTPLLKNNYILYTQEVGLITPSIADFIDLYEKELTEEWVRDAILETSAHGAKVWSYTKTVLDTWKIKGRNSKPVKKQELTQFEKNKQVHDEVERMLNGKPQ